MARLGIISDTHGRLDHRVAEAFDGVDRVIHAGDIGAPHLLMELGLIAPLTAVLGNCDRPTEHSDLAPLARLTLDGVRILVVHDRSDVPGTPEDVDVVVFGHSHRPLVQRLNGVLWVNPGSAQQPRGSAIGKSVALLEVRAGVAEARIIPLSEVISL